MTTRILSPSAGSLLLNESLCRVSSRKCRLGSVTSATVAVWVSHFSSVFLIRIASFPTAAPRFTRPAAPRHRLPQLLPLLGGHSLPVVAHSVSPSHAASMTSAKAADQNAGQYQETNRLREVQDGAAEQPGDQPIPELHNDESDDRDRRRRQYRKLDNPQKPK